MNFKQIENLLERVETIPSNRNYWLVRTMGGLYYQDFIDRNFIAIGYDGIPYSEISYAPNWGEKAAAMLAETVKKKYPDETKPKYAARQVIHFVHDIKKGDIVIIPGAESARLTIGEVIETPTQIVEEVADPKNPKKCTFAKRKKVRWIKEVRRDSLEPNLYKLLYSHHAITEAKQYDEYIDKTLSNFYIKNDVAHIILEVKTRHSIKARELFRFGLDLLDNVDDYCNFAGLHYDTSSIYVKTNINSPGKIEFTGRQKAAVAFIGLIVLGVTGGGLKIGYNDFVFDLSTKGLIQNIIEYQNSDSDREFKRRILENHMKELQLKTPDDLVKILQEQNDKEVELKGLESPSSANLPDKREETKKDE